MIRSVVLLGASMGGPEALKVILSRLARYCPPILVTQHMLPSAMAHFAHGLDRSCQLDVLLAKDGMRPASGQVLLAPSHAHMLLHCESDGAYAIELDQGPPVRRQRPSVDVMFASAARSAGKRAVGIVLSGMGNDGARGLWDMRRAGALTLAQDEASCVVASMPANAVRLGAVEHVVALKDIAQRVLDASGVAPASAFVSATNIVLANA